MQETEPAEPRVLHIETEPELADQRAKNDHDLSFTPADEFSGELGALLEMRKSPEAAPAAAEGPVKVFSYMGTPSDNIGNNGDFYVDEMCNILYGPKVAGIWPEDGIEISGPVVCKRSFIGIKAARATYKPDVVASSAGARLANGFMRSLRSLLRLLRPSKYRPQRSPDRELGGSPAGLVD